MSEKMMSKEVYCVCRPTETVVKEKGRRRKKVAEIIPTNDIQ
jgi:hypothetical protein